MAWENQQMSELVENGVRGDVVKHVVTEEDFNGMFAYARLTNQLENIHSWEEFKQQCQSRQLYGNTKSSDLWILAGYFFRGLSPVEASREIGYALYIKDGKANASNALYFRLRRMNITNPYVVIETIIDKGWMGRDVMQNVLKIPKGMTKSEASKRNGKYYRFYAKFYVTGAIEAHYGNVEAAAETLKVPMSVMQYWVNLEVNDPRV